MFILLTLSCFFIIFFSCATTFISVYTKLLLMSKCGQPCSVDAKFVLILCTFLNDNLLDCRFKIIKSYIACL